MSDQLHLRRAALISAALAAGHDSGAHMDLIVYLAHLSSGEGHPLSSTFAGVQGLREILDELTICVQHISSESVQRHARLLQLLQTRKMELCKIIGRITAKGTQYSLKRTFCWHLQAQLGSPDQARVMHCLLTAKFCYMRRGT